MKYDDSDIQRLQALERELAPVADAGPVRVADADQAAHRYRLLWLAGVPAAVAVAGLTAALLMPLQSDNPPQIATVGLGTLTDTDRILEGHAEVAVTDRALRDATQAERLHHWFDDPDLLHYRSPWGVRPSR